jgi:hypothetical protein
VKAERREGREGEKEEEGCKLFTNFFSVVIVILLVPDFLVLFVCLSLLLPIL